MIYLPKEDWNYFQNIPYGNRLILCIGDFPVFRDRTILTL